MKEELQGKLVEILTSIQAATGKAADFAMSELPDIAQQYVVFGRVFETLMATLFLIASVVFTYLTIRVSKGRHEELAPLPALPAVIFLVLFLCALRDAVMVWTAPKVWLLTEIARLIK